jgi:hypothetical protein
MSAFPPKADIPQLCPVSHVASVQIANQLARPSKRTREKIRLAPMSAVGQKQTWPDVRVTSALPPIADMTDTSRSHHQKHLLPRRRPVLMTAYCTPHVPALSVEIPATFSVALAHNCTQGSEFLAASLAKLSENIERISVSSDKLPELRKTLVGFKISIENFSSYFFSACHDSR